VNLSRHGSVTVPEYGMGQCQLVPVYVLCIQYLYVIFTGNR